VPPRSRRRPLAFVVGVAAVLVVGGLVAVIALGGSDGEHPDTDDRSLAGAIDRTVELDRYVLDIYEEVETFEVSMRVDVDGDVGRSHVRSGMPLPDSMVVGDTFLTLDGDVWRELPPYDATDSDIRLELTDLLGAVDRTGAVEIDRDASSVTYETSCRGEHAGTFFGDLCRNDDGAQLAVTVDLASGMVTGVRYEGRIPVYGGVWEDGFLSVEISDEEPQDLEVPDWIDRTGVECLAEELGLEEATSAAVTAAIQDMTTAELGELYGEVCGYLAHPPGKDFGVR
jgi:hypothetical protein